MSELNERRAKFVYGAARLAAQAANAPVIPVPWDECWQAYAKWLEQKVFELKHVIGGQELDNEYLKREIKQLEQDTPQ